VKVDADVDSDSKSCGGTESDFESGTATFRVGVGRDREGRG
jgi:hypothetical protein